MATTLKGAPVADAINARARAQLERLAESGVSPTLAMVRVGAREDDLAYESGAMKRCEKVGVQVKNVVLDENISLSAMLSAIEALNCDEAVHGVLIFMPLPKQLDSERVRAALNPDKDVDGITDGSLAGVFTGCETGFAPCTAQACIEILDYYNISCAGKKAVVIGRSLVVGKPAAMLLLGKNATVTICHTKTADMPAAARDADILIVSAGKPRLLGREFFSEKQVVIDVGINFLEGRLCGDVDFDAASEIVSAVTPVPGGVGTVTSSVLVSHVVEAAARQQLKHAKAAL